MQFFKETLLLWSLAALGTATFCITRPRVRLPVLLFCLAVPTVMVLIIVSLNVGLNRYVRYIIPVLPFVVIWASQSARLVTLIDQRIHKSISSEKWQQVGVLATASMALLIALMTGPHWLSYFNMASGGLSRGYEHLCDCNVDWGQDLPAVNKWLASHPEAQENLRMAFFGSYDPVNLGVNYRKPVFLSGENATLEEVLDQTRNLTSGWYIVSKNYVLGHPMPMPDGQSTLLFPGTPRDALTYLQALKPVDEIGGSMFVYQLSDDDVARIRKQVVDQLGSREPSSLASIPFRPVANAKFP